MIAWGQQELEQSQGELHMENNIETKLEGCEEFDKLKGREVNFRR